MGNDPKKLDYATGRYESNATPLPKWLQLMVAVFAYIVVVVGFSIIVLVVTRWAIA